jgi:hypothetical protein
MTVSIEFKYVKNDPYIIGKFTSLRYHKSYFSEASCSIRVKE